MFSPSPTKVSPTPSAPMLTPRSPGVPLPHLLMVLSSPTAGETATSPPTPPPAPPRPSPPPPVLPHQVPPASSPSDTKVWCTVSVHQWTRLNPGVVQVSLLQVRFELLLSMIILHKPPECLKSNFIDTLPPQWIYRLLTVFHRMSSIL